FELEAQTPEFERQSVDWVQACKKNKNKFPCKLESHRRYRYEGQQKNAYFGVDTRCCRWRRDPSRTEKSAVFYYADDFGKAFKALILSTH
ncbi:MAG: hypothetical protein ACR2OA_05700, partial [Rubripirellula sp.]